MNEGFHLHFHPDKKSRAGFLAAQSFLAAARDVLLCKCGAASLFTQPGG